MRALRAVPPVVAGLTMAAGCTADDPGDSSPSPPPSPVSTIAQPATTTERPVTPPTPTETEGATGETRPTTTTAAAETSAASTSTTTTTTLPPLPPPPNEQFDDLRLGVERVVAIAHPTAVAWRPTDGAMFVATQDGEVLRVSGATTTVALDLTDETAEFAPGSERGLLGLAFDPRDGRMFVDYTDLDDDTNVVSYELDGDVAVKGSRRQVLSIDQPGLGHNGGRLLFDRDGNLLVGSGDGGASNGRDAQDTSKLLGAILRITPSLDGDGYTIPPDNPFVDGVDDRPEIWARGFRNPWSFSLDRATGDLWVGDVGNERMEEIDVMRTGQRGLNFGWYWYEGTHQRRSTVPDGLTPPVYDYPRSVGVAVMGGFVYRGHDLPELEGAYLFGDLGGPLFAIGAAGVSRLDAERVTTLVGWAEDPEGELYVLSLRDGVYRLVRR